MSLSAIFDPMVRAYFKKKFGGESGGTVVNPDGSGVLKLEFSDYFVGYSNVTFFKLADEPFRMNPNSPVPPFRIKAIKVGINPFNNFGSDAQGNIELFDHMSEIAKTPVNVEGAQWDYMAPNAQSLWVDFEDGSGYDMLWYVGDGEYDYGDGMILPKGLYAMVDGDSFLYPEYIEIAPASFD